VIPAGHGPLRTLLFAPGSDGRKLAKVASFGADAVVLDLEDAVADDEKTVARSIVREALERRGAGAPAYVRVNGADTGRLEEDVEAVVCPGLAGIMVPKVEEAATLPAVDARLGALEAELGWAGGSIALLAIVETARGIVRVDEIAEQAPPRLVTLVFGLGDFSVDIGVDISRNGDELLYARSRVVVAARAGGLDAPVDGPYLDIHDLEGLDADCRRSRALGFQGRVIVYPGQVETAARAYSQVSDEEAARCRAVVEAFEAAEAAGSASIQVGGRFVDYPIYERAKRTLELAGSTAAHAGEPA
jgi:citrate lyase subunit beta/citryl-CoA lyase